MAKHPTLVRIGTQALERLEMTQKDAAARIGGMVLTSTELMSVQEGGQSILEKLRAFSENPGSSTPAKPAKGKKKGKSSEITLEDLLFLQDLKQEDVKFIVGIMQATGQSSLTREQMTNLISLRK